MRDIIREVPLFTPRMPRTGKAFSLRMTNCGPLGWVSDQERGYPYQATHPQTGAPWSAFPRKIIGSLFRFGGTARGGVTRSIKLSSGDALVLGGAARLAFHGIDRIMPSTSTLLAEGGRFNLTLRRVTLPA